jgi:hypothetical protein
MSRTFTRRTVEGRADEDPAYADRDPAYTDRAVDRSYRSDQRVHDERWMISPTRIIGGLVGIMYLIVGIVAMVDAGLDGTLNRPIVHVWWMNMSAAVGIGVAVAGLLLLLGAATPGGSGLIGAIGVLSLAAGVFGLAASVRLMLNIGADRNTGWFLLIGGIICIVAMFFGETLVRHRTVRGDEVA